MNPPPPTESEKARAKERSEFTHRVLFAPLVLVPSGIALYFAKDANPAKSFTWFHLHPLMMLFGFVAVAGNAVRFKKTGGMVNTQIHQHLMWLSWSCAMFGAYVIYSQKETLKRPHLTSPHGQSGAVVLAMMLLNPLFSSLALNPEYGSFRTNATVRFLHKMGNRFILAFAWVTSAFGIASMLHLDEPNHGNQMAAVFMLGPLAMLAPFVLV